MRNALLSSLFVLALSGAASAMPFAPPKDTEALTPVAMGCGPAWTRGPYGNCHPMGYGYGYYRPYYYRPYHYHTYYYHPYSGIITIIHTITVITTIIITRTTITDIIIVDIIIIDILAPIIIITTIIDTTDIGCVVD